MMLRNLLNDQVFTAEITRDHSTCSYGQAAVCIDGQAVDPIGYSLVQINQDELAILPPVWRTALSPGVVWTWGDVEREAERDLADLCPEYIHLDSQTDRDSPVWPEVSPFPRWIACFAVRGGSEGWYTHIDAIHDDKTRYVIQTKMLCKFWSQDEALQAVEILSRKILAHEY